MSAASLLVINLMMAAAVEGRTLNPVGPVHVDLASRCLVHLVNQSLEFNKLITIVQEKELDTPGYEIQELFLKRMNGLLRWSYEATDGERNNFESYTECHGKVCKHHFQTLMRSHYYMVISKNFESIYEQMAKIKLMKPYRHRSIYLIYYYKIEEDDEATALKILERMYELQHYKTYVFIPEKPDKFNIYVFDLYSEATKVCGATPEMLTLNYCENGRYSNNRFLIRTKYTNLRNCSVRTVAMMLPPYVINARQGLEIRLLNALGEFLNITFNISLSYRSEDWGEKNGSTWDGLLARIIEDPFAIGVGGIALDQDRVDDFDYTIEYFVERMVWVVPAALQLPHWKVIFVIYKHLVWVALFSMVIFFGAAFFLISYHHEDEYNFLKFVGASMVYSLQCFSCTPVAHQPKTLTMRIVFISVTLFSIVIACLYQSCLVDVLTNPRYEHQIQTEDEIFDSDYDIGGIEAYRQSFNETGDARSLKIFRNYKVYNEENDTMYQWLLTVARDRKMITILGSYYVTFLLAQEDSNIIDPSSGQAKIFVVDEILFHFPIRMLFPKGFPLRDVFNRLITSLKNAGIMEKWAKEMLLKKNYTEINNYPSEDQQDHKHKLKVITLQHVQGAFALLIFGCLSALLFFVLELLSRKLENSPEFRRHLQRSRRKLRC